MICLINYMEPLPSNTTRKWRLHQIASILSVSSDVSYVSSSFDHFSSSYRSSLSPGSELIAYKILLLPSLSYKRKSTVRRVFSYYSFSFFLLLFLFRSRPSRVFASYPHGPSLFAVSIYKLFFPGVTFIVDIRDALWRTRSFPLLLLSVHELLLWLFWIHFVDILTGPGSNAKGYLPNVFGFVKSKSYVNLPFTYEPLAACDNNPISFSRFNPRDLVFVGSLVKSFDLKPLMRLSVEYGFNLEIAGDGPMQASLSAYLQDLGDFTRVSFRGFLNSCDASCLMSSSSVGLLPYAGEGFSSHYTNKFAEYLFHGLFLLVPSACSEMASFIVRYKVGYAYSSNAELEKFFVNPASFLSGFSRSRARSVYAEHFSSDVLKSSLRSVFLCSGHSCS